MRGHELLTSWLDWKATPDLPVGGLGSSTAAPPPERTEAVNLFYTCLSQSKRLQERRRLTTRVYNIVQIKQSAQAPGVPGGRPLGCRSVASGGHSAPAPPGRARSAAQDPCGSSRHVPAASAPGGGAASGQSWDLDPGPAPGEKALRGELVLAHSSTPTVGSRAAGGRR